jgi:hypothetical protein
MARSLIGMALEPLWMCVQVAKGGSCKITVLGHDVMYYGKYMWVFRRTFLPPSSLRNPNIHTPENLCFETGLIPPGENQTPGFHFVASQDNK